MKRSRLTVPRPAARSPGMTAEGLREGPSGRCARRASAMMMLGAAVLAGGCVQVSAPDKPIVIELNINIKQEVIYRLAEDASNTIESNPDIF